MLSPRESRTSLESAGGVWRLVIDCARRIAATLLATYPGGGEEGADSPPALSACAAAASTASQKHPRTRLGVGQQGLSAIIRLCGRIALFQLRRLHFHIRFFLSFFFSWGGLPS